MKGVEERFVVEVTAPVTESDVGVAAVQVASELNMPTAQVIQLLSRHSGPLTRPVSEENARGIAGILRKAGVQAMVVPASELTETPPPNARLTLTDRASFDRLHDDHEMHSYREAFGRSTIETVRVERRGTDVETHVSELSEAVDERPRRIVVEEPTEHRWSRRVLAVCLLLALAIFVVLQVYPVSLRTLVLGTAPSYEAGLEAFEQGDYASARSNWLPLANRGDARAQHMLGTLSEQGFAPAWSSTSAAEWYRRAARQGLLEAQHSLGLLYRKGAEIPRDDREALRWFRMAAEQGHAQAQYQLALMLFNGWGTPRDFSESLAWYERAAAGGVPEAVAFEAFLRWQASQFGGE
ncbi:MAG: sel1 repeat family protein [Trueperaceae bacterium]|nr:MAG: sel1 repeat family protein [Trueperaceae bacterium]